MEGRKHNCEAVIDDFLSHLKDCLFIAVDAELTGVNLEPDEETELAWERYIKFCRRAETYEVIQLGFTLVHKEVIEGRLHHVFRTYLFHTFPYVGPDGGRGFYCDAQALVFNLEHGLDFNTWIADGIRHVTREAEADFLRSLPAESLQEDHSRKWPLLRLWKGICDARLPLVVHTPCDLFFLLSTFERRKLPRDTKEFRSLWESCFSSVYDTAYLKGFIGGFKKLKLSSLFDEAKQRHDVLPDEGRQVLFSEEPQTYARYHADGDGHRHEHEAGYDSLLTAQLFLYLQAIAPHKVEEGCGRLFLFKNNKNIDLGKPKFYQQPHHESPGHYSDSTAGGDQEAWEAEETYFVAQLVTPSSHEEQLLGAVWNAGFRCSLLDEWHVLVRLDAGTAGGLEEFARLLPVANWAPYKASESVGGATSTSNPGDFGCGESECRSPAAAWLDEGVAAREAAQPQAASGHTPTTWPASDAPKAHDQLRAPHGSLGAWVAEPVMEVGGGAASQQPGNMEEWWRCAMGKRFVGTIKSANVNKGYGFVECRTLHTVFHRDVYVALHVLPQGCYKGSQVSFGISPNAKGWPQVRDVVLAESWWEDATASPSEFCGSSDDGSIDSMGPPQWSTA